MELLVKLDQVSMRFGSKPILDKVSLSIYKQQSLAIIGPNGSGKSTLLRLIAGLSSPTEGKVLYGHNRRPVIGWVPDRFPKLPFNAFEYLMHMGQIREMDKALLQLTIPELLQRARLENAGRTWIRNFSKGMLQKLAIVQAVLEKPELLLMDEPLSGLDEESEKDLLELFLQLKAQGVTLVFACHEAVLWEKLADRTIRIHQTSIESKTLQEGPSAVVCIVASQVGIGEIEDWHSRPGVMEVAEVENGIELKVDASDSDALLRELLDRGGSIVTVNRTSGGDRP
ncbi:ATP-binding cassette domain-containing protein [Paenibacillus sp. J2TS4]|uniref:ATP-binding cassette domain-containing protein n=1 Tax=Paenibacillus sp. J2TS4 TaxID=2807194 RepID=UPI001B1A68BA|nr:ABC transporter ATP-binding protein [Paenibacillus sp. J2TS4]GIP33278.1 ABC transporter ATP-binding protein [Paenibacillus sp. J2TS4]